ncbi:hypothetical protein EJD97_019289 [Solanum chilense]|uniref:Uncharacterized protein n=1 Tax=Solanum chilense TaxID=4083 RepID=A0A6N2C9C6_SOLCI|nr:hypothetical protein EJD97_019289 [Solanum chilense]
MQQAISEVMCMDLGFQLWNSPVTVTILLQEVIAVYPNFLNSTLTMKESARISNALTVFQCMAYHPEARMGFLKDTQVFPLCLHCIRHGDQPICKVRPAYNVIFLYEMRF